MEQKRNISEVFEDPHVATRILFWETDITRRFQLILGLGTCETHQ